MGKQEKNYPAIRNPSQKESNMQRDFMRAEFRAVEGEERKFILSFSSEEPYTRYWGNEVLDHTEGAMKLDRLLSAGCLLFNHKRDCVIGKITRAWTEKKRGNAEVEFDTDAESEVVYQKVKSGTLRGVSVGYIVNSWEEVIPGKLSADGRFTGPCDVARSWEPYEISVVSCPADYTVGIGRDLDNIPPYKQSRVQDSRSLDWFIRQTQTNINFLGGMT